MVASIKVTDVDKKTIKHLSERWGITQKAAVSRIIRDWEREVEEEVADG